LALKNHGLLKRGEYITVEQITDQIPSWGKYVIESYWYSGVTYHKSNVLDERVKMIIAENNIIKIYID